MKLPFAKMHGLGNDFVVIDERHQRYSLSREQLVHIADRRFGVGCDQILFLEAAQHARADARYRVVNADGSPAEHCGNGIRCVARFIERGGEATDKVLIEIDEALFELTFVADTRVRVDMGAPSFEPGALPLLASHTDYRYTTTIGQHELEFGAVSFGNPHAVIEVAAVDAVDVAGIGAALQASPLFPASVNVGFMQIGDSGSLKLRVFERGAGETLACGTGACAAVAIGRRWGRLADEVSVQLRGGELMLHWDGNPRHSMWMTGPATFVFDGSLEL
jgi:diaminopimelate epimerase